MTLTSLHVDCNPYLSVLPDRSRGDCPRHGAQRLQALRKMVRYLSASLVVIVMITSLALIAFAGFAFLVRALLSFEDLSCRFAMTPAPSCFGLAFQSCHAATPMARPIRLQQQNRRQAPLTSRRADRTPSLTRPTLACRASWCRSFQSFPSHAFVTMRNHFPTTPPRRRRPVDHRATSRIGVSRRERPSSHATVFRTITLRLYALDSSEQTQRWSGTSKHPWSSLS